MVMPFVHGKDTEVMLGAADLSGYTDNTEFPDERDMSEVTTYGRSRKNYVAGLKDGVITISGSYDYGAGGPGEVINAHLATDTAETFLYKIAGTGTGLPQRSVDVLVKKFTTSSPVADKVAWAAELQMVGDTIDDTPQA